MPPLREYSFESLDTPKIEVKIRAHSLEQAFEILVMTTKHPSGFKCTSV